ncbi:MFS transporter [Azohydromonas aeria]|uniref:MFS transporter n=1 Tax=Azohydromonas aeria TaxID=2590212 RepID=UPI0012FC975F|nr:MFS transporter [Azohydromonas aeria]
MYRFEWFEQVRLGTAARVDAASAARVSPVVWALGFTSLLTDISAEMVNSTLPVYLVLHLRMSPAQYGLIDGLYNGFAVALLALLAGWLADRHARQKELALVGYGVSALCKLALLGAASWGWLLWVVGLDRAGKGLRTAPRDALISLNSPSGQYAGAFALHRALDACGSLLGPIVAFALLAQLPGAFDAVWMTSFIFGLLGVAVLWCFVPRPARTPAMPAPASVSAPAAAAAAGPWITRRLLLLAGCGALLALATISDGFIYLLLQQRQPAAAGWFPLFYVVTAAAYMLLSLPAGRLADRAGRARVFLGGYAVLIALYAALLGGDALGVPALVGCLCLLGLFNAATEGVLMAMASAEVPAGRRTTGLALVATGVGLGKLVSSVLFGWLWQAQGTATAVSVFIAALGLALFIVHRALKGKVLA